MRGGEKYQHLRCGKKRAKLIGIGKLATERLVPRKLCLEDAEALNVCGSLAGTRAEAEAAVRGMLKYADEPNSFHWVTARDGVAVGRVKVWRIGFLKNEAELGCDVGAECRGRGYMTVVLHYLLRAARFRRVVCTVRASNAASIRVCEKAGMPRAKRVRGDRIRFVMRKSDLNQKDWSGENGEI